MYSLLKQKLRDLQKKTTQLYLKKKDDKRKGHRMSINKTSDSLTFTIRGGSNFPN